VNCAEWLTNWKFEESWRGTRAASTVGTESVYWPDAYDFHGSFQGAAVDFVDWVLEFIAVDRCTSHFLGQSLVLLGENAADVETYFTAYHVRDASSGDMTSVHVGRYLDKFEKRAGEWRILRRDVVGDFRCTTAADGVEIGGKGRNGTPSMEDPSYAILDRVNRR
jgi:hypothetical protein